MPPNFIPHPDGGQMLAPLQYPEAHTMTLDEIEQHFVTGAPYEAERKELMNAFRAYAQTIWRILPGAELWINGGFCTLKDWEAPNDIDIAVGIDHQDLPLLSDPSVRLQLDSLRTQEVQLNDGTTTKVHAMGGQIDAYMYPSVTAEQKKGPLNLGLEEHRYYDLWSSVKGKNGTEIIGIRKGFIKVVNPCIL